MTTLGPALMLLYPKPCYTELWYKEVQVYYDLSHGVRKPAFGVSNQVNINRAVQPQKMAKSLTFQM